MQYFLNNNPFAVSMELEGLATQGAAGTALGMATAAVLIFLKKLLKIFAAIQIALLAALELSGLITVNWGKISDTKSSVGGLIGDAATDAFDVLTQMGSFGSGFAIGFLVVWVKNGGK